MEITRSIYQIEVPIPDNPLGHLNCYLIEGKVGWTLLDTGWPSPEAFDALKSGLRDAGLGLSNIDRILLTHAHPDHYSLAGRIMAQAPKAVLSTHPLEGVLIKTRYLNHSEFHAGMDALLRQHGVPEPEILSFQPNAMPGSRFMEISLPDRYLYGGEIISTGVVELEVIWTPGHSPGHICLYERKNGLLFSGDHILPVTTPNVGYHTQSGDNPLGDYLYALSKMRHLPVSKVLPGHEQPFTDFKDRLDKITEHHLQREEEIRNAVEESPLNAYDISAGVSWNLPGLSWDQFPPIHRRFAVTETIAHLEYMRWEGKVEKIYRKDGITYRSIGKG